MNRFFCGILAFALLLTLCACAPGTPPPEEDADPPATELERLPEDTGREDTPPEAAAWQAVSIERGDYSDRGDTDPADCGSLTLARLCACYLRSGGFYADDYGEEIYRRFMEAPNLVLNYFALIDDRVVLGGWSGEMTALEEICQRIASEHVNVHKNTAEFTELLQRCRESYPEGRVAEILDLLEREYQAALRGSPGYVPPVRKPPEYESVDWQVISSSPEEYGLPCGGDLPDWPALTLAELCTCYLHADGGAAEGSSAELYRRFMDAPDTVLNYLALLVGQTASIRGDGNETDVVEKLCDCIAMTDIHWVDVYYPDNMQRFYQIMGQYRERYPAGRIAEILDILQEKHDLFVQKNPGYTEMISQPKEARR